MDKQKMKEYIIFCKVKAEDIEQAWNSFINDPAFAFDTYNWDIKETLDRK